MRKRKRRIPCRIEGCETPIMYDRLMCRKCWMTLPSGVRKKHMASWRELRPFVNRSDNKLLPFSREDYLLILELIDTHNKSVDYCTARANFIRQDKDIPPDNSIENELKGIGLI